MRRGNYNVGNGDTCPLDPEHGTMLVISGSRPMKQYCPHRDHNRRSGLSRNIWPLYGFEEAVEAHRSVGLPDLSDLEV